MSRRCRSSYLERLPGFAEVILGHRGSSRDVLTIVSNSGRNALRWKWRAWPGRGITTIGITSLTHSGQVGSRDPVRKTSV